MVAEVSRRSFLRGVGASTALIAGAGSALAGCSSQKSKDSIVANERVTAPAHVPYGGVRADLTETADGVQPGFFAYPRNPLREIRAAPGSGSDVSAMANMYFAPPPGLGANKYWQGLNERLGVNLKLTMVPAADYSNKFATTIAGNELPDLVQMMSVRNEPELLQAKFADLTEHLSGDAIKKYPNLANIAPITWRSAIFNGAIYGIPVPRAIVGNYPFIRTDIFKKLGLPVRPKNYEEFHSVAKELSDPKQHRWAFAVATYVTAALQTMLRAPNGWKEEGGKLTNLIETDEWRNILDTTHSFWKEGLIYPDAFDTNLNFKQLFNQGTVCIQLDGYPAWAQYLQDNANNPGFDLGLMVIPGWKGGVGGYPLGPGYYSITAIKKTSSKQRIEELLRIANWMAAPFGTEEYLFRWYGVSGIDYRLDTGGDPIYTAKGLAETVLPIRYVFDAPPVIYQPGRPQDVKTQYSYQETVVPHGIQNPTVGLFSNTNATTGVTLTTNTTNMQNAVIQGRKSLSDWDEFVGSWRSQGGNQIRKEYEQQLQKNGGPAKH